MNRKRLLVILVLVLLVGMAGLAGCRGYKAFSLTEGIGHFSFEYPSRYKLDSVRMENIIRDETFVRLYTLHTESVLPYYHDAEILVYLGKAGDRYQNSEEAIESTVSNSGRERRDWRLIERSGVKLAGIRGEQVVSSFTDYILECVPIDGHLVSTPAITREVFFDYGGLIWSISVTAHESFADTAEADFKHILETFKILK